MDQWRAYLGALLLDVNGWASWCAYLRWSARLEGGDDDHIVELLAVRLAWELLLFRVGGPEIARQWAQAMADWPRVDLEAQTSQEADWLLQHAVEIAWQDVVCGQLVAPSTSAMASKTPPVQAAFRIDVRSEVFRRALEGAGEGIQTLGFAGFFGLAIDYTPIGSAPARAQLPRLFRAPLRATDTGLAAGVQGRRANRLSSIKSWKLFKNGPLSSFSFVDAFGLRFGAKMLGETFGGGRRRGDEGHSQIGLSAAEQASRRPRLVAHRNGDPVTADEASDFATKILRGMSLTRDFATLVVLVGHGSETRNNPHAAGYDCGACCGQTGEVNARAVAAMLNEGDVREGLRVLGIDVPETTRFVGVLHNTTTDEVTLFETAELPVALRSAIDALEKNLKTASAVALDECAPTLGLDHLDPESRKRAIFRRAHDWSEVRPEWGLTNNAGFIVAPRERSRHMNLAGRSFLHDYSVEEDKDFNILELIMTAPMVVTLWINFQYYASTVDNLRYGSGNKVLHNVVGGHLGVFEGNGGDLRIGLPLQSIHDGDKWRHDPLLSQGRYVCSIRTMYRILSSLGESHERRAQRGHATYEAPFVRATAPNEVWVWDITALPGPQKGQFYYLYAVMDLYSRFVGAWQVAHVQSGHLAERLFVDACATYDIAPASLCVHSDRGSPMTSYRLTQMFKQLNVAASYSRPRVSDDNPHIESQFKTLKYQPEFPLRFDSFGAASAWCDAYYAWYNQDHHHAGIALYTPANLFFDEVDDVCAKRQAALDSAYEAHPERFVRGRPIASRPPAATEINPADLVAPDEANSASPSRVPLVRLPNGKGRRPDPQLVLPISS